MSRRERALPALDGGPGSLGAQLRLARQAQGIRLSALAARLGYSKGHLSAVETGRVRPSAELVAAYESVLDLQNGELAGRGERGPSPWSNDVGVGEFLARARQGVGPAAGGPVDVPGDQPVARATPRDRAVLRDLESVLQAAAELIEDVQRGESASGEEILFISVGQVGIFSGLAELSSRWRRALRAALERGWDVVHLCSLDGDADRSFALVTEMLALVGFAGHYQPYAVPGVANSAPPYGLLVVPGHGAMLFLATHQAHSVDAAFLYTDPEHIAVLRDHGELLRSRAAPILKIYRGLAHPEGGVVPQPDLLRYDFALSRAETRPGDRLFVKDGLSSQLIPTSLYQELARRALKARGEEWTPWIRTLVENRLQRVAAFHDQVKTWRFRDLCSRRAIARLATEGHYVVGEWLQASRPARRDSAGDRPGGAAWASPEERRLQLQAIVDLLKAYPNYELGLLDDPVAGEVTETYWEVKGREGEGALFLATWCPEGGQRVQMNLEITQPAVVEAFRAYFASLWERLPPENRDRQQVIAWLQTRIDAIPRRSTDPRAARSGERSRALAERATGEAAPAG